MSIIFQFDIANVTDSVFIFVFLREPLLVVRATLMYSSAALLAVPQRVESF